MFLWDNFNIIHRDIKPENIFITDSNVVILLDFGTAKRIMTSLGGTPDVGTPDYKAPEFYQDVRIINNCKADCYAVGLILHFLCA